jgi:hypothetical protein
VELHPRVEVLKLEGDLQLLEVLKLEEVLQLVEVLQLEVHSSEVLPWMVDQIHQQEDRPWAVRQHWTYEVAVVPYC